MEPKHVEDNPMEPLVTNLDLTATLDGVQHKLEDLDWALIRPCGCAEAICLAVLGEDEVLASEQAAFVSFEPVKRKRESMIAHGYTIKLMKRPAASNLFLTKCTHESVYRARITYTRPDSSSWTNTYGPYRTLNTARGVATQKAGRYWPVGEREVKIQRATITWEDMP